MLTDPLAGIPGSEAEADSQTSAEIRGGARVLEVAQLFLGELVDLRQIEAPRDHRRLVLGMTLGGGTLLTLGMIWTFTTAYRWIWGWAGLGLPALVAGVGLLVLAWTLYPHPSVRLGVGKRSLLRFRAGRFELEIPRGAEGELCGARDSRPIRAPGRVVLSPDLRVWLRVGALEVRVGWVRPARGLPRAHTPRRVRWGIGAALALSFLVHQLAMFLVLSVPPATVHLRDDDSTFTVVHTRRVPPDPETSETVRRMGTPMLGLGLLGPPDLELQRCVGRLPTPEVYLGHLRASGSRSPGMLRRVLGRRLRALELCYQAALASCVGKGRIAVSLLIRSGGESIATLESAEFALDRTDTLTSCVRSEIERWRFAPVPAPEPTRVRVPILFRFVGADRYYDQYQGK